MFSPRLLLICAFLVAPATAAAQTDEALAKQYYKLGEELYNRADYEGALKQFQQSYQLSKKPPLLYNMARCQEALGQPEKAIEHLTEYLKTNPENAKNIESRIANLRRLVERKQQDDGAKPADTPPPPPPPEAEPPTAAPTEAVEPPPPPPRRRSRPMRLVGWITTGVGGAVLVSGIVLGVMAKSQASTLEEANRVGANYDLYKDKESTQRNLSNAAIGTIVGGAALAVTGAVLLVLDWRSSANAERRSAWVVPTVGPQGAGLAGQIRF